MLIGGAVAAGGVAAGGAVAVTLTDRAATPQAGEPLGTAGEPLATAGEPRTTAGEPRTTAGEPLATIPAGQVVPFHGDHQAGVATPPQAHAAFLAFTLMPSTTREGLARLLKLLTDDARRLTQGRPALADTEPGLAELPGNLTVTFGLGPGAMRAAALPRLRPLPRFTIDRLQERWSGGDLLVQLCCDDPVTLAHAQRMIVKDTRSFAKLAWVQKGFRQATQRPGLTQRNLMGQLDGTVNPQPGTPGFDRAVWIGDGPLRGGTMLVLRRIRMHLDRWDAADSAAKEFTVGRRLDTGAPLTGTHEHDEPDYGRLTELGFPVIADEAHIRRAHVADPGLRMLRRAYNYDDGPDDIGLLFAAYQADVETQFTAVQRRLAEVDLLNEWTTPVGSAVFYLPPGCGEGGWIGERLLT
ncbi:Dyp-type peroxidase [Nonomuraea soli]